MSAKTRQSSLTLEETVVLTVEKPVTGGRMLARHDGQVVFVAGAIPGERVRARIERISKQLAYADTIDVLDPSPDRRTSGTDWGCGGSLYAHIAYPRQLTLKSQLIADAFTRIGKLPLPGAVPMSGGEENGYRMRARLHVRHGRFGFFREGTHELCDAASTRQLLPETLEALSRLHAVLSALIEGVRSYEIVENAAASERAVLLEIDPSRPFPVAMEPVPGVTGIILADRQSSRLTIGHGSPYVTDRLELGGATVSLTHHIQSFFQGNRFLLTQLVGQVLSRVAEGTVTDLYAGVGLFAVPLAAMGRGPIVAVEGDRSSARDLENNAAPVARALSVEHLPVERYLQQRAIPKPDTLILDPPRTGVSPEAMSGILRLLPPRVVYVSCDPPTLARDVKRLAEAGYWLDHIEGFDLFPNTAHVETLVSMIRREAT